MRKWIPLLIVTAAFVASAVVFKDLPERVPTHWNFAGEVDGWSNRTFGAWMMPVVLILMWALMRALPAIDPRSSNYAKFGGAFEAIMISVMLFMLAVHIVALRAALGYDDPMRQLMPLGVGALLVVIGNLLPRARSNWFVGIRTPWTLSSDRVWEKTHRFGGRLFVLGGLVIALSALLTVSWAHWVPLGVVAVVSLAVVIHSYVEWKREKPDSVAPAG